MWYNIDDEIKRIKLLYKKRDEHDRNLLKVLDDKIFLSRIYEDNSADTYKIKKEALLKEMLIDNLLIREEVTILENAKEILEKYSLTGV